VHLPQLPAALPTKEQSGASALGQGAVALLPLSPLQTVQVLVALAHTGLSVGQSAELVQPQVLFVRLQVCELGQSESCKQPTQVPWFRPLVAHSAERQIVAPLLDVQGPLPLVKPHLLSLVSHTALEQTSVPASPVQLPLSVGFVCGASAGSAVPFAKVGVQVWAVSLHQLPAAQSASTLQPFSG
jgi:hypothetical protein